MTHFINQNQKRQQIAGRELMTDPISWTCHKSTSLIELPPRTQLQCSSNVILIKLGSYKLTNSTYDNLFSTSILRFCLLVVQQKYRNSF